MLTTEQLNAIKERAEKATNVNNSGWYVDEDYSDTIRDAWDCELIAQVVRGKENDAEFIAHAREDIPALLQTVEALSAILAETEETRDKIAKDWSNLLDERVTLKAKIATYESLAQEFDYGAILDEMACEAMKEYEGGGTDD
ncbi:hypothetical protein [Niallia circulans]|uniref:hypothetical protein n=1 Tax=Niallia circulans TaxID=1397 RepID=UPI00155FC5DF|nr:hypothetical protein [Niallia circulans]NRG33929.1 hypothetical protein [Niallia circulans]